MKLAACGLSALLLCACASIGTPYPHWATVGRQWGCDPLAVQAARFEYAKTHDMNRIVPEVGWSACDLLARVGEPERVDQVQVGGAREHQLYFRDPPSMRTGGKTHLVTLEPAGDRWTVAAVVW